jgi:CheY-like chemotaxis protein
MSALMEHDVLLVEDNPEDVELTRRSLERARVVNTLAVARDGAEALDFLLATGPFAYRADAPLPKVIFLDLKLPKLSGLEVIARIRAEPAIRHIPVVVLTSSAETPDIARAYALGANSYLVKPVEFEKFVEAVGHAGLYWLLLNQPPR